jgi:Tol biopolymer transport system component
LKKSTSISETDTSPQAGYAWLRSPKFAVAVVFMIFAVWVAPKPRGRVIPVDGVGRRADLSVTPQRRVVWRPAEELSSVLPKNIADASLITPRMADGGTTLYFALRSGSGQADIYRSRLVHGNWQTGKPVAALNSAADDVGAIPSADGRTLFLYSNRAGGTGGFDIYVSEWRDEEWTVPVNAGRPVNSFADDYDPAISPDGRTLYFASNRVKQTSGSRYSSDEWSGTLRQRKSNTFDMYAATRNAIDVSWESVNAVDSINRTDSNEGAPFVSSNGAFLYFASDRPVRGGERQNLDLFRSNITGATLTPPENLGPGINTRDHETEPALSPEGFTLVFSAHRNGSERLLLSRAEEVMVESGWDTSNLRAVSAIWPQGVLITLLVLMLAAVLFATRKRFVQAAGATRFFAGSVMIHVLLLFVLAVWNLPKVIDVITSKTFDAEASTQLFDDNQHQSHEDGRAAYEKLADLQSLENMPQPDVVRLETEAFSVPERTDSPLPTIPLDVARTMSSRQLLFVPSNRPQSRQRPATSTPMPALPRPTPVTALAVPDLEKTSVVSEPVKRPGERPVATQIDMPRTILLVQPVRFDIQNPTAETVRSTASVNAAPPAVRIGAEQQAAALPSNPLEMRVAPIPDNPDVLKLAESIVLPAAPVEAADNVSEEAAPLIEIARVNARAPTPVPFATSGRRSQRREPQPFVDQNAAMSNIENRPADPAKMPKVAPRETAPSAVRDALAGIAALETEDVELPMSDAADSAESKDHSDESLLLVIDRSALTGPTPLTPQKMSGPSSRVKERIVVGAISLKRNNAPPAFHKRASQLDRPFARASAVSLAADSVGLRSMFTLRQGDTRKQFIELFGGTEESEKAVNRGLLWLVQHQNSDGSWSLNRFQENCDGKHPVCNGQGAEVSNTAATGLALLPLLAAGNTHVDGEYANVVATGLQWLIDHQKPDGELLGPGDKQKMYSQGIAAIAMCEAFGMTQHPDFREPAQRSLQYIVNAQNKTTGGWRYNPGEAGDTSVVGWQMMALKSGEMAGLDVPTETHEGIRRWLKSVEGNRPVGGQFGYTNRTVSPAMSAEGLLCLQFLGTGRNDPAMRAGADYLLTQLPDVKQGKTSYYWYYGTQVMYHMQGNYWQDWNTALRDMVVNTQIKDGHMAGTWNPVDNWEKRGGRLYSTSMKLLLLEIYYRHLPLYEQLDD